MTLFADIVEASRLVAETSARSRKIAILALLLRTLDADEVPIVVGFLSGVPRQGRVGIGYATVYATQVPWAGEPSLSVDDVDRAITEIEASTGPGSTTRRRELLEGVLGRATAPEADFLRRLLTGELRQGALAGLMADAVAKGAGVPGEIARRALMLSGDLTRMAQIAMTEGEPGLRDIGFRDLPPDPPDARVNQRERGRRAVGLRAGLGRVEARRNPHPDPSPRRPRCASTRETSTRSPRRYPASSRRSCASR